MLSLIFGKSETGSNPPLRDTKRSERGLCGLLRKKHFQIVGTKLAPRPDCKTPIPFAGLTFYWSGWRDLKSVPSVCVVSLVRCSAYFSALSELDNSSATTSCEMLAPRLAPILPSRSAESLLESLSAVSRA